MAHLCALKRTAELSKPELRAWYGVLGQFPPAVVNAAVIELAIAETRFPEIGDLYQICRRKIPRPYAPHGDGANSDRPTRDEIRTIAAAFALPVD